MRRRRRADWILARHRAGLPSAAERLVQCDEIDRRLQFALHRLLLPLRPLALRVEYVEERRQTLPIAIPREVQRALLGLHCIVERLLLDPSRRQRADTPARAAPD